MRLYSRTEASAVTDPVSGEQYGPGKDGGFDFPEPLGTQLHGFHANREPLWETDIERQHRLIAEEDARRADPATLLGAVEKLVAQAEAKPEPAAKKAPAKAAAK